MKKHVLAVCLLLLLGGVSGCAAQKPEEGQEVLSVQPPEEPATPLPFSLPIMAGQTPILLNPLQTNDPINSALAPLLWEGLFELDTAFVPQPLLCERYSALAGARVWTFQLRDGVTFSDGTALTAEVVAQSLEQARQENSPYANRLSDVSNIQTEGTHTLILTLATPNGNLPALLDIPIVRGNESIPAGTGPYTWTENEGRYALTATPNWWQKKARPFDNIPLSPVLDEASLLHAFSSNDVSLLTNNLLSTGLSGAYAEAQTIWDCPSATMIYVGFNSNQGVCRNASLRQALSRLFDRETLAQFSMHAQAATLPVSPASPLYVQERDKWAGYAPDTAMELLREAGYRVDGSTVRLPNAAPLRLRMIVNGESRSKVDAARALVQNLKEQHIDASLKVLTFRDFLRVLEQKDFDLYLGEVSLTADFDLTPLLAPHGALNYGGAVDRELGKRLQIWRIATGEEQAPAASDFFDRFLKQAPLAVLCFKNTSVLSRTKSPSGMSPAPHNPFAQMEQWR